MTNESTEVRVGYVASDTQIARVKERIDELSYKIYKEHQREDMTLTVRLNRLVSGTKVKASTFRENGGYYDVSRYNGIEYIENKGKFKLNPYKWLRGRNLGESNDYYIEEVYDKKKRNSEDGKY